MQLLKDDISQVSHLSFVAIVTQSQRHSRKGSVQSFVDFNPKRPNHAQTCISFAVLELERERPRLDKNPGSGDEHRFKADALGTNVAVALCFGTLPDRTDS
jgi:hypothetical protein